MLSLLFFFLLLFVLVGQQHLVDVGCACAHTLVHVTTVHVSLCASYCGYYIAINGTSQCNLQARAFPLRPLCFSRSFPPLFPVYLALSFSLFASLSPFLSDFQASIQSFSDRGGEKEFFD